MIATLTRSHGAKARWSWARSILARRLLRELAIDSALTAAHRDARCATARLAQECRRPAVAPHEP
jgi:hypothetical protein